MLDLTELRNEFADHLNNNKAFGMDGALSHVCRVAYEIGLQDGRNATPVPAPFAPRSATETTAPEREWYNY